jgi:hypothetical protein
VRERRVRRCSGSHSQLMVVQACREYGCFVVAAVDGLTVLKSLWRVGVYRRSSLWYVQLESFQLLQKLHSESKSWM